MTANTSTNRTALVTGASGGIGAALTREIGSDGDAVVLTARREPRLQELAAEVESEDDVSAAVYPKDLADPDGPRELFEEVRDDGHEIHTLVTVAGFPVYGRFEETPVEEELEMLQGTTVALTHLTKLFLGPMAERGEGAILNVGSLASFVPLPRLAVYGATKAHVLVFTEALAHELADEAIHVTALCPASVDTPLFEKSDVGDARLAETLNDPASVAEAGWNGLKQGDRLVRPSMRAKLIPQLRRLLPRSTATTLGANATARPSE